MTPLFSCVIPGRPYVKKNSQKVVRLRNGRKTKINTEQFSDWEKIALAYTNRLIPRKPIDVPLRMRCIFCFADRSAMADLSALYEGIQDVLQKQKIIMNDSQIKSHDGSRCVYYAEPMLIVDLYEFEDDEVKDPRIKTKNHQERIVRVKMS